VKVTGVLYQTGASLIFYDVLNVSLPWEVCCKFVHHNIHNTAVFRTAILPLIKKIPGLPDYAKWQNNTGGIPLDMLLRYWCSVFQFSGAFAKLRKATISFAMCICVCVCVCLSVCLPACLPGRMEHLSSDWTDFHEVTHLSIFRKSVEKIQGFLKSGKNNGYFT
jgi:hypothetical protein